MGEEEIQIVFEAEDGEKRSFVADLVPAREYELIRAENEKLREQGERLFDKTLELATENDKLRELVQDMVLNMGGCALHGNPLRLREFGNRAKELGVEA